jgi:hypothetical protein
MLNILGIGGIVVGTILGKVVHPRLGQVVIYGGMGLLLLNLVVL